MSDRGCRILLVEDNPADVPLKFLSRVNDSAPGWQGVADSQRAARTETPYGAGLPVSLMVTARLTRPALFFRVLTNRERTTS